MGTCEEISSSVETQNGINLGISCNGSHHNHPIYEDQPTEEEALARQFESVVLQGNGYDVKVGRENERDDGDGEEQKLQSYPLRPYAVDCSFYLKTGTCKFGPNCRYNHPSERAFQPNQELNGGAENNGTMDTGKIDCKYFRTPGGCKYGDACRYNHSAMKSEKEVMELNFLGLPVRPSEQECTFYLRTGSCGYGASCRFHHPDPTAPKEPEPRNTMANGVYVRGGNDFSGMYVGEPLQSSGVPRGISDLSNGVNSMNGLPYGGMSSYHQALPQNAGWNHDQVNLSLSAKTAPLPHQIVNFSSKTDPSTHYDQVMHSEEFPLRPGQLDCEYFMKTGDCKYRAACRYNHPVSRAPKLHLPPLSSKASYSKSKNPELPNSNLGNTRKDGTSFNQQQQMQMQNGHYPERPGLPECEYYMKTGNCKYKSACRYHHPRDRMSTSAPCALNESGLPLRPGSKICRNYELQGTCKYGRSCLFNHPDESATAIPVQVADQHHSSSNLVGDAEFESPAEHNVESDWGDGWAM